MNFLNGKIIQHLAEISIISLTFLISFQLPVLAQTSDISNTTKNSYVYSQAHSKNLGVVSAAITTNLGTRYTQINSLPATIYKDVLSIEEVLNSTSTGANDDIITKNMLLIREYRNISSTDIEKLLEQTYDKQGTLKSYLDILKSRFNLANRQIASLEQQKQIFEATMTQTNELIEQTKTKISTDFSSTNTSATLENIDTYLELKDKYNTARTYVIFINKFIAQYQFLNNYNSEIANVIIKNSEAIIKDATVVIPESGNIELLEQLDLIIEE